MTEIAWPDDTRRQDFEAWLAPLVQAHGLLPQSLRPASADASFRRYLRVDADDGRSYIIMDAPPALENSRPFVDVAGLITDAGLHAPAVLAQDLDRGFLLLADLGERLYLQELQQATPGQAHKLMCDAIDALVQWQTRLDGSSLPAFDEALLMRELTLFPDWCVAHEFGVTWDAAQREQWDKICRLLIDSALAQPQVPVHRDYMPRNLMVTEPNPGILDFQDAVRGPISYDIACLLRDAFLSWDEERELDWAIRYWEQARKAGLPLDADFGEFWRALEWMGLQRHLKVMGIFCRLKHRDGKPRYSTDLPRFFAYATKVALRYQPLKPLLALIEPLSGDALETAYF
ncbi:MAG: phosphotransferase [Burkholderiaceae bacterium]|nr:phosphotransferase [Burkholderiaceae bacterium]